MAIDPADPAAGFALLAIGKLGGERLIAKAFSTDDYSPEDMKYIAEVLRHCSCRTLWRTFDSCNNYKMPKPVPKLESQLHYWYAEHEEKARKWDIRYIKENVPGCTFQKIPGLGHGGLATLQAAAVCGAADPDPVPGHKIGGVPI